jgi:hypothetical protein
MQGGAYPGDSGRLRADHAHRLSQHDKWDGWEREGEFEYFFHEFSEERAYPFAVNANYYRMTR